MTRAPRAHRVRRALGRAWALPVAVLALLMAVVPPTSSAFTARVAGSTNSVASNPYFTCGAALSAYPTASTFFQYPLNEAGGATAAADYSGTAARRGTYRGGMTSSTAAPLPCDDLAGGAYALNGTSSFLSTPTAVANPTSFTLAVWFKATVDQGAIIGFANQQTGTPTAYDRVIYQTSTGRIAFGIFNLSTFATQTVTSRTDLSDGTWHFAAASLSPTAGTALYIDGVLVDSNATYTTPQNFTGYWRLGSGNMTSWPGGSSSSFFQGSLREAVAYRSVLPAAEVMALYVAGR